MPYLIFIISLILLSNCYQTLFPEDVHRSQFVAVCQNNNSRSVCECAYDKMEKQYSSDEFKKIESSKKQVPEDFLNVMGKSIQECR